MAGTSGNGKAADASAVAEAAAAPGSGAGGLFLRVREQWGGVHSSGRGGAYRYTVPRILRTPLATALLAGMALAIGACSEVSQQDEPDRVQPKANFDDAIPSSVSDAIRTLTSSDEDFAQIASGKFVISQDTPFCDLPGSFGISSEALDRIFESLGQSRTRPSGRHRGGLVMEKYDDCARPDAVISASKQRTSGVSGYAMTLAVWQGEDAYWVATIERADGLHPRIAKMPPPMSGDPNDKIAGSILLDGRELAEMFATYVLKEVAQ